MGEQLSVRGVWIVTLDGQSIRVPVSGRDLAYLDQDVMSRPVGAQFATLWHAGRRRRIDGIPELYDCAADPECGKCFMCLVESLEQIEGGDTESPDPTRSGV